MEIYDIILTPKTDYIFLKLEEQIKKFKELFQEETENVEQKVKLLMTISIMASNNKLVFLKLKKKFKLLVRKVQNIELNNKIIITEEFAPFSFSNLEVIKMVGFKMDISENIYLKDTFKLNEYLDKMYNAKIIIKQRNISQLNLGGQNESITN